MSEPTKLLSSNDFNEWFSLNDTIMGGSSEAVCKTSSKGLSLEGVVVEEKGGFVSCKSPVFLISIIGVVVEYYFECIKNNPGK